MFRRIAVRIKRALVKTIRACSPYSLVVKHDSNNLYDVIDKFEDFKSQNYSPFDNTIRDYNVFAVHGTGGSGSGALMDFMREIEGNACLGTSQPWAKVRKSGIPIEFDFLRLAGGLLELEKLCDTRNYFVADAMLHDCVDLLNFNLLCIKRYVSNSDYEKLENAVLYFLHKQIAFIIEGDSMIMNYHLFYSRRQVSSKYRAYWPQMITKTEYLNEVQRLLCVFFSVFFEDCKQITLVHPFADTGLRLDEMKKYIPNLKLIIITRDDCDVYVQGMLLKWNMWFNVQQYIQRKEYLIQATVVPDGLHIKFENLVCNYDETRKMILKYLEVPEVLHHAKTIFDPRISIQNVGIHKQYPKFEKDCELIKASC